MADIFLASRVLEGTFEQFRDGVMLRMCCGLTLATLFVRFFDKYYVATIPKSTRN